ncbi:MAG: toll/interleukin-1 receptor domain-containing protein [Bacteroidaceae bacterium]|nr:toll/interleukin-1 receptor domain-containing protein [Bacteroidaceae bacterium]
MAKKPTQTNRNSSPGNLSFDVQSFVESVYNDDYLLVVGTGVILNRALFPETGGDINQYIINEINNERSNSQVGFSNHNSLTEVFLGTKRNEVDPVYQLLAEDFEYQLDEISPELTDMLRTRLFRFVMTTTIDGYLETLMRDIWGDELRVVNIEDVQSVNDFNNVLKSRRNNKYTQPTLIYAFGKVVSGRPKPRRFVETDTDAIRIIEKWMKLDNGNDGTVPFLKSKRIIALGCKYDDWYFRFFWYILTRSFSDEERSAELPASDNLAMLIDSGNNSELQLKKYMQRIGVCIHEDVWGFMKYITYILTSTDNDSPCRRLVLDKRREGGIFISYKSCDVAAASDLFFKLSRNERLRVWFDNVSLKGGDDYNAVIDDAINKALIVITVLSPSIAQELEKSGADIDTYYSKEWRIAANDNDRIIIPVAVGGYDLRGRSQQIFEKIIGRSLSGIDLTGSPISANDDELAGIAKLIESINNYLGIES